MFNYYNMLLPQLNNGPFHLDCEEKEGRKRTCYTSEKK